MKFNSTQIYRALSIKVTAAFLAFLLLSFPVPFSYAQNQPAAHQKSDSSAPVTSVTLKKVVPSLQNAAFQKAQDRTTAAFLANQTVLNPPLSRNYRPESKHPASEKIREVSLGDGSFIISAQWINGKREFYATVAFETATFHWQLKGPSLDIKKWQGNTQISFQDQEGHKITLMAHKGQGSLLILNQGNKESTVTYVTKDSVMTLTDDKNHVKVSYDRAGRVRKVVVDQEDGETVFSLTRDGIEVSISSWDMDEVDIIPVLDLNFGPAIFGTGQGARFFHDLLSDLTLSESQKVNILSGLFEYYSVFADVIAENGFELGNASPAISMNIWSEDKPGLDQLFGSVFQNLQAKGIHAYLGGLGPNPSARMDPNSTMRGLKIGFQSDGTISSQYKFPPATNLRTYGIQLFNALAEQSADIRAFQDYMGANLDISKS